MNAEAQKLEMWAIVEVMGYNRFAGFVTEQPVGGASLLRIDVPEVEGRAAFTKFIGVGSIYAITPCTEETARAFAAHYRVRAVIEYDLPRLPAPETGGALNRESDDEEDLFEE